MSPFQRATSESNHLLNSQVGDIQQVCPLGVGRAENLPVSLQVFTQQKVTIELIESTALVLDANIGLDVLPEEKGVYVLHVEKKR